MGIVGIVLLLYLALMLGIAWYFSRHENLEAYFLNKRKSSFWLLLLSNFASMMGAGATVALVSEVYNTGISFGIAYPLAFLVGTIIMGFIAKPIKRIGEQYKARSIVDFFEKRFDKNNARLAGICQLFLLVSWVAVQATAISAVAAVLIGIDQQLALVLAAAITIIYTALGGLKIDLISDFIQFWIITIVFTVLGGLAYKAAGGFAALQELPAGHFDLMAFGGIPIFAGIILFVGFVWVGNTTHWQRIFSAESEQVARKSYFWLLPLAVPFSLTILFIGLFARLLLGDVVPDQSLFVLMEQLMPPWLLGIGFAAVLAASMSSLDSLLVGGSTILYQAVFGKERAGKRAVLHARALTAGFGLLGFLFAYLVPGIVTLSIFCATLALVFVPPVLGGMFSKGFSKHAAFWSLLLPLILLLVIYPFLGKTTFTITMPVGVLIAVFYDKVFKQKRVSLS